MDPKDASDKLVKTAVAAGWQSQDVEILPNATLNRAGCSFYTAVHKRRMDGPAIELAELPDGSVVSGAPADVAAAASLLARCGADAPADWWAEVVARFSGKAAGRVVKSREQAYDVGEIEKHGETFHAPVLEQAGDSTQLRFYSIRYEPSQPFRVSARLSSQGALTVTNEPLGAN